MRLAPRRARSASSASPPPPASAPGHDRAAPAHRARLRARAPACAWQPRRLGLAWFAGALLFLARILALPAAPERRLRPASAAE
jgi:hypothetical protein